MLKLIKKPIALDVISGLQAAKDSWTTQIKTVLDTVVVPVIIVVCVFCLVKAIFSLVRARQGGEDYSKETTFLIIAISVTILFSTWYAWGPLLF